MSCPNFTTQEHFPLYLFDDSGMDEYEAYDFYNMLQSDLEDVNSELSFFQITVRGGYYSGAQFYVELTDYAEEAGFDADGATQWADNEQTRYYFGLYLSQAKRRFAAEQRKVCRLLDRLAGAWGFERYYCRAIFSSGEAVYEKAENTQRSRIREAVSA